MLTQKPKPAMPAEKGPSIMAAEFSTGKSQDLREVARNLNNVQGAWEFQVYNNVDDVVGYLKGKLEESEHKAVTLMLETLVKQPIRRQLGRIKAALRHLAVE